jgi:hypothetical protein
MPEALAVLPTNASCGACITLKVAAEAAVVKAKTLLILPRRRQLKQKASQWTHVTACLRGQAITLIISSLSLAVAILACIALLKYSAANAQLTALLNDRAASFLAAPLQADTAKVSMSFHMASGMLTGRHIRSWFNMHGLPNTLMPLRSAPAQRPELDLSRAACSNRGIWSEGLQACSCFACSAGPTCAEAIPEVACTLDASSGTPVLFGALRLQVCLCRCCCHEEGCACNESPCQAAAP